MTTATMGRGRRATGSQSSGATATMAGAKRPRVDNNNSPSQGNLNSDQQQQQQQPPAAKRGRKPKIDKASKIETSWAKSRNFGTNVDPLETIGLPSVSIPYMSPSLVTYVGSAAPDSLNEKSSYLDISNMRSAKESVTKSEDSADEKTEETCVEDSQPSEMDLEESDDVYTFGRSPEPREIRVERPKAPFQGLFRDRSPLNSRVNQNNNVGSNNNNNSSKDGVVGDNKKVISRKLPTPAPTVDETECSEVSELMDTIEPSDLPNVDPMYEVYQPWVIKTYGDMAKTKTITVKKYSRILRVLRGEEANSAENSKFRFWVKSKGFHIGRPEDYESKPADRIVGRHTVFASGNDPSLYVPTQLPHSKVRK